MKEVTNISKIKGFLLTVDIEKAFDSVNHLFIFYVLEKFEFGKNSTTWIKKNLVNGLKTFEYEFFIQHMSMILRFS